MVFADITLKVLASQVILDLSLDHIPLFQTFGFCSVAIWSCKVLLWVASAWDWMYILP